MSKTASSMLPLRTPAPPFTLPDPAGRLWTLPNVALPQGLLVMFLCNHCPYVQHVAAELARIGTDFVASGIGVVAINSNDIEHYPQDRPELMAIEVQRRGYTFPYLFDATQEVAIAYRAACTPDFFLFDQQLLLVYRGQLDDARPGNGLAATGRDLRAAAEALLSGESVRSDQKPSIGCNIKWRGGIAPAY